MGKRRPFMSGKFKVSDKPVKVKIVKIGENGSYNDKVVKTVQRTLYGNRSDRARNLYMIHNGHYVRVHLSQQHNGYVSYII